MQEAASLLSCQGTFPFIVPVSERANDTLTGRLIARLNDAAPYDVYRLDTETGQIYVWMTVDFADGSFSSGVATQIMDEIERLCCVGQKQILANGPSAWLVATESS